MACFILFDIKKAYIFLCAIKVQAAKRLTIVIIYQNTKIAFIITMSYAWSVKYCSGNRFNYMKAL